MKTSHLKSIFAILLLSAITFTSCKKDHPAPKDPILGSWVGKYSVGNVEPANFYRFNILPNGVLQITDKNKVVEGTGTWNLMNDNFTAVYTYDLGGIYNLAAKYNKGAKTLIGDWGTGKTVAEDGKFFLNKE